MGIFVLPKNEVGQKKSSAFAMFKEKRVVQDGFGSSHSV